MRTSTKPMQRTLSLSDTTVGKKILMAVTGVIYVAFVIGHMVGNLKVYQGREHFNDYAEGLRTFGAPFFGHGQLLWIIRIILIISIFIHITMAALLTLRSRAARSVAYTRYESLAFSYASRTMVWGGIIILLFIIYHLLHFTFGVVHPDFRPGDPYHNFVAGFQQVPASLVYIAAMVPLGFHLYHGVWSAFQTLGANNPRYNRYRRPFAAGIALIVVIANISFPLAVMAGVLRY
jgi:succinate dehydrogenase / fumarate reductase, cytochrome b subunit